MTPKRRKDYNEITNAVRVLATEYQYSAATDQWYLQLSGKSKAVPTQDVKTIIRHLAAEAYVVDTDSVDGQEWIARVYARACVSPETTVLMWIGDALELLPYREMRGCDLHTVWACDHGIYNSPTPFNNYKTPSAVYTATYKAQARRFYDTLAQVGEQYGIRRRSDAAVPHGVKFTGCTLRPPHQVPTEFDLE